MTSPEVGAEVAVAAAGRVGRARAAAAADGQAAAGTPTLLSGPRARRAGPRIVQRVPPSPDVSPTDGAAAAAAGGGD